ncbi:cadmium-translocating P-type ATPase [Halobacillus salinarum]|uniref:Cd(2+)-exporting ATPase n=1 Tax=Halobacillus salinarum TaxID=2932257 RepID=A0ABY4EKX9_9BACI|nr:heavy metal translocating P-type ATPase [Halobacillus salinarum]UOQ44523.1 cadmium-translocating P-type ATPase [Halobacillus salinarum]
MKEYKIQGLSCANCAADMERQVRQLTNGGTAELKFNTSKLVVHEDVNLDEVKSILKADGAALVEDDHDHDHSPRVPYMVIVSAILFGCTFFVRDLLPYYAVILLYVSAMLISGYSTFVKGAKNLFRFKFTIETLMTVALIGAVAIGEWREATIVAILFGLNEFLEGMGMEKARHSMEKLLQIAPKQATLLMPDGEHRVVAIDSLKTGDMVLVKAGEKIPSDGVVVSGVSSVNEAAITGESLPVEKFTGDSLFGGSLNNEGTLEVKITKAYKDSSLARILHLVEEAQETKTPTELFINRFSKYYTPFIMLVSIMVMLLPPLLFNGGWEAWLYQGLAVLIVGCPCALILSSPIAIVSGITKNARNGILVKGGSFLELLGKIDTIAFDKTGTLTKGKPSVQMAKSFDDDFYRIAGSIEKNSSHPIARAVMEHESVAAEQLFEASELKAIPGEGIEAVIDGKSYWMGNERLISRLELDDNRKEDIDSLKNGGYTLVITACEDRIMGIFGVADEIREESREMIHELQRAGITQTVMLTGDHKKTAEKIASKVGVSRVYAGLLPEEKVEKINKLSNRSKVAMIGDGINDAPALAAAHLGIAMGKGTDSAIETADIVLMQDHLGKLPASVRIAKKVNRVIKLNLTLALGLKLVALFLTIPGLLTLWIAILADMGATVLVTLLSLSVLVERRKSSERPAANKQAARQLG